MPLCLEPNQQFPVVLDCDAEKPQDVRPTFFAKSQSMRGQQKIGEVLDLWTNNDALTITELFDSTIDVLRGVVVGWKNMGANEFSHDALRDVLTYTEAREMLRKVMYNQHITAEEKKSTE
jgi:hypothetical protein